MILFLSASRLLLAGANDKEKSDLALDLATLFRAGRKVISDNQDLINDASKGDKGLSAEKVIGMAKENYQKAAGRPLSTDESTPAGKARAAMIAAMREVMAEAQPMINEPGKGFKGFLPAFFARHVAEKFSKAMDGKFFIKLTAPANYIRNRANRPDEWENGVIENKFKSTGYRKGQHFGEAGTHKGVPAYRLIVPEYYGESCLTCHGTPQGEVDISGGKKEGGVLGELGGAISVVIYE
jgi:hypothetical protein